MVNILVKRTAAGPYKIVIGWKCMCMASWILLRF